MVLDTTQSTPVYGMWWSIKFPTHEQQKEIVAGFKKKLWLDFDNCVHCIDDMLVWTNKPNKQTLRDYDIGPMKYIFYNIMIHPFAIIIHCCTHMLYL